MPAARISRTVKTAKPKQNLRLRPAHRHFVASLNCLRCGHAPTPERPNECAHVRVGTDGSLGQKPSDRYSVPLCPACHRTAPDAQHTVGEVTFWGNVGVDPLDAALRLWTISGDAAKGADVIFKVRQRIALHANGLVP